MLLFLCRGRRCGHTAVLGEDVVKGEEADDQRTVKRAGGQTPSSGPRDLLGSKIPTARVDVIEVDMSPIDKGIGVATPEGPFRKRLREVLPKVTRLEQQSEERTDMLMRQLKDRVREVERVLDSFGDQFAAVAEELSQREAVFKGCRDNEAGALASLSESKDYLKDGARDLIKGVRQTALAWQVDCKTHISSLEARGRACLQDMAATKARLKAQQDF